MDESIVIIANMVGIICLVALLSRLRYTVSVKGRITNWSSRTVYTDSGQEYSIEFEYIVKDAQIKNKKILTRRDAFCYREGDLISLRLMPNNPYKCIITHDRTVFRFKFLVIVAVVIDIYTYLEMHNILSL